MQRRAFLGLWGCLPLSSILSAYTNSYANSHTNTDNKSSDKKDRFALIPGYQVKKALQDGVLNRSLNHSDVTMLSRLDLNTGKMLRRAFPLRGHQVCVHPQGKRAFYACQSRRQMLSFDLDSLEIEQIQQTHNHNFVGGGHAIYSHDGSLLISTERCISSPFEGDKIKHYGRLVIRDAFNLKVLDVYNSHGILPHELQFLDNGKHLAIAHYGSVSGDKNGAIKTIEPSISIVELASGKLLHKFLPPNNDHEIRHLTIRKAVVNKKDIHFDTSVNTNHNEKHKESVISISNRLIRKNKQKTHHPAPAFYWSPSPEKLSIQSNRVQKNPKFQRAQSVIYDPVHDEAVVTVTATNQIAILNAADGQLKLIIPSNRFNIQRPRGVALLDNPKFYAVAGSLRGLVIIKRGTHQAVKYFDTPLYQHSHITIA